LDRYQKNFKTQPRLNLLLDALRAISAGLVGDPSRVAAEIVNASERDDPFLGKPSNLGSYADKIEAAFTGDQRVSSLSLGVRRRGRTSEFAAIQASCCRQLMSGQTASLAAAMRQPKCVLAIIDQRVHHGLEWSLELRDIAHDKSP
jgi:hypothetical protein